VAASYGAVRTILVEKHGLAPADAEAVISRRRALLAEGERRLLGAEEVAEQICQAEAERRPAISDEQARAFLESVRRGTSLAEARNAAGVSRDEILQALEEDEQLASRFRRALAERRPEDP
jgi:hypothetical protein